MAPVTVRGVAVLWLEGDWLHGTTRAGTNGRAPRDTLVCMVRATAPTTGRLTLRPFERERLAKAAGLPHSWRYPNQPLRQRELNMLHDRI